MRLTLAALLIPVLGARELNRIVKERTKSITARVLLAPVVAVLCGLVPIGLVLLCEMGEDPAARSEWLMAVGTYVALPTAIISMIAYCWDLLRE